MAEVNPRIYSGWHRGIGDASNSPVLELLIAGELTETYPRALHIAQADDANTDWNVAAAANPTIYLHSTTTPATDYVRMDHDGTDADIDAVGATNLNLQIAGTTVAQVQANALTLPTDDDFIALGASDDVQLLWSDGDASNHAAVIAIGDTSQQLHITDVGAKATDWNVSAATHPELYIHSNTTPATDYIRIGAHDGTTAYVDVVGGTTLSLQVAGTEYLGVTSTAIGIPDDVSLELGTTDDSVIRHRTATLAANTALTDVLIGTPVSAALEANSTMISNVTASGDVAAYVNVGGNSAQFLFADASASALAFGQTGWSANFLEGMVKVTLGTESTFGTTQPTNTLVMRAGTAPVGAITTAVGLFASTTVVRKIIADGTVSNVET